MTARTISTGSAVRQGPKRTALHSPSSAKKNRINSGSSKNCWVNPLPRRKYRSSSVPHPNIIPAAGVEKVIGEGARAAAAIAAVPQVAGVQVVTAAAMVVQAVAEIPVVMVAVAPAGQKEEAVTVITAVAAPAARKSKFPPKAIPIPEQSLEDQHQPAR